MSKRLGESGVVVVRITFNSEGFAKRANVIKSSGYERIDTAGRDAALKSRIAVTRPPGATDATEYVFNAPLNFVLN